MKRFSLSATNLATHHHLQCDLFLYNVYHGSSSDYRHAAANTSELTKAQFERGNDWEGSLLAWLDEQGLLLTVRSSVLDADDFKAIIEFDDRDHFYVTGLSFWPPQAAFDQEFLRAGALPVSFGLFKPDLIEITRMPAGTVTWRVIDAKASKGVKVIFAMILSQLD
jgi:hypothetical protein